MSDVREHLDAPACQLCGCPDADKVLVEIPWTGRMAFQRVCRGHPEHPDHPGYGSVTNARAEQMWQCEVCEECCPCRERGVCWQCRSERRERHEQRPGGVVND